jgi:hypothetical protein
MLSTTRRCTTIFAPHEKVCYPVQVSPSPYEGKVDAIAFRRAADIFPAGCGLFDGGISPLDVRQVRLIAYASVNN